ncbi:hypothetical protein MIND_00686000 [Mycena indigotica]|uniref:Uncharacterized protein n=1 Tax=Mycena indigotica TaxID=2126181 RepID=A0A8H6SMZ8_9AGAR|nr:uncharacterized protein MIND_00686000 [Mycena indigotica]KAF7301212.1 hypothetical protein MIND_00686000 [Mycena indigotica]
MLTQAVAIISALAATTSVLANGSVNHAAIARRMSDSSLEKRESFSGRTTFYGLDTGADACTGRNHGYNDWVFAMNMPQFGSCCGKKIKIQYKGKTAVASCVDACASCYNTGEIDLTPGLFSYLTDGNLDLGQFTSTWWFVDGDGDDNKPPPPPPPPTKKPDPPKTTKPAPPPPPPTEKPKPATTKKEEPKQTEKKVVSSSAKPSSAKPSSSASSRKASSSSAPKPSSAAPAPSTAPGPVNPDPGVANVGGQAAGAPAGGSESSENTKGISGALSGTSGATSVLAKPNTVIVGAALALLAFQAL